MAHQTPKRGSCVSPAATQAYRALQHSIEQICRAEYASATRAAHKAGRKSIRYRVPAEADLLVHASSDVCGGKITPEEAMAMIHIPEVNRARFKK